VSAARARGRPRQERRTLTYKTVGSCAIEADLHRPVGEETLPLVFWIHGGGLIGGSRRDLLPRHRNAYLMLGLAILAIDYRLAPETRLEYIVEDVRDAYEWAATNAGELGTDPTRVALVGHSGGAYLAFVVAEKVRPSPRAVVSFSGYGDILGDWYTQPSSHHLRRPRVPERTARKGIGSEEVSEADILERWDFYVYCRQRGTWPSEVSGLDPVTNRDALEAYCPVRHVSSSFPPALLLHGDADKDVPHQQSVAMVEALTAAGADAELISVPRCGHAFEQVGTAQAEDAFARVLDFLRARLDLA